MAIRRPPILMFGFSWRTLSRDYRLGLDRRGLRLDFHVLTGLSRCILAAVLYGLASFYVPYIISVQAVSIHESRITQYSSSLQFRSSVLPCIQSFQGELRDWFSGNVSSQVYIFVCHAPLSTEILLGTLVLSYRLGNRDFNMQARKY